MQTIPETTIGLEEMKEMFGFGDIVVEAYEDNPSAIGFRAPFWQESESERDLVLSWRNRAVMSSPGCTQSPTQFFHDSTGALNEHFGEAFHDVKFSLLTGVCVTRSDIGINEFVVTSADAALHVLLLAVWPDGHAPSVCGLRSDFGRQYGAIDFARVGTDITKADFGQDYWLLPIESLGQELCEYLRAREELARQEHVVAWRQYGLDCSLYRKSMIKLVPLLEAHGLELDCGGEHHAFISDTSKTRRRLVWYNESWRCQLLQYINGGGIATEDLFRSSDLIESPARVAAVS